MFSITEDSDKKMTYLVYLSRCLWSNLSSNWMSCKHLSLYLKQCKQASGILTESKQSKLLWSLVHIVPLPTVMCRVCSFWELRILHTIEKCVSGMCLGHSGLYGASKQQMYNTSLLQLCLIVWESLPYFVWLIFVSMYTVACAANL